MMDLSRVSKYYVACGYTDLRRGIDGLAAIVTRQFGKELREDSLFLFCGRRTDRIKALYYSQSVSKEVNTSFETCGEVRRRRPHKRPRFRLHRQHLRTLCAQWADGPLDEKTQFAFFQLR